MFQGLSESQVKGAVEAMLFVTDEPVGALTLAKMLDCDPALVEDALSTLRDELAGSDRGIQLREVAGGWRLFTHPAYHELIEQYVLSWVEDALSTLRDELAGSDRGIQLREVAGGWRLFTHPAYHELIEQYVLSWDTRKLSAAAMETLAVVAYAQPVTRAGVASVRGVNSDSSINSLVEKGLVREAGVADTPGNPVLYATTRAFLEKFGLRSTADGARGGRGRHARQPRALRDDARFSREIRLAFDCGSAPA